MGYKFEQILLLVIVDVDMLEVFQGEHKKQKVAIKSLKDQTHDLQRFLAEASVMTLVLSIDECCLLMMCCN